MRLAHFTECELAKIVRLQRFRRFAETKPTKETRSFVASGWAGCLSIIVGRRPEPDLGRSSLAVAAALPSALGR
jgi:hypothetical protein